MMQINELTDKLPATSAGEIGATIFDPANRELERALTRMHYDIKPAICAYRRRGWLDRLLDWLNNW